MTSNLVLLTSKLVFLTSNLVLLTSNLVLLTSNLVLLTFNLVLLTSNLVLLTSNLVLLISNLFLLTSSLVPLTSNLVPVMQESVPQSLKDRILKEVDINNDGVIDYDEFLLLGKLLHQEVHLKFLLLYRGRILGRNWDKSLKSSPPCYSQSPLLKDFAPPPLE